MKNIEFISDKELMVDGVKFVPEKVSEPEFQIGQWYVWGKYIYRVINIDNYWVYVQEDCSYIPGEPKFRIKSDWGDNSRPATESEIESHLRKICDEKGYRNGVKIKNMKNGEIHTIFENEFHYYSNSDSLHCSTPSEEWKERTHSNPAIYRAGKFADIISDKKPLPKTRGDHKNFLADFCKFGNIPPYLATYHESFLDQYDFEL